MATYRNKLTPAPAPGSGKFVDKPPAWDVEFTASIDAVSGFRPEDIGEVKMQWWAGGKSGETNFIPNDDIVELHRTFTWHEKYTPKKSAGVYRNVAKYLEIHLYRLYPEHRRGDRGSQVHLGSGKFDLTKDITFDPHTGYSAHSEQWYPIWLKENSFDRYQIWVYIKLDGQRTIQYKERAGVVAKLPFGIGGKKRPSTSIYDNPNRGYHQHHQREEPPHDLSPKKPGGLRAADYDHTGGYDDYYENQAYNRGTADNPYAPGYEYNQGGFGAYQGMSDQYGQAPHLTGHELAGNPFSGQYAPYY